MATLIAWAALKLKTSVKTARELRDIFGHGKEEEIRAQYQEILNQLEYDKQVLANEIAEATEKKKIAKLTSKMSRLTDKQSKIQEAEGQFLELAEDYHQSAGQIPSAKIQEDLRKYMNNRNRVELWENQLEA